WGGGCGGSRAVAGPSRRPRWGARAGHPDGAGNPLSGHAHAPQPRSASGGEGGWLRDAGSGSLLRPLRLPDHRGAAGLQGRTAPSPELLRPPPPPDPPALLRGPADLPSPSPAGDPLPSLVRGGADPAGMAVDLHLQLLHRRHRRLGLPQLPEPLLVPGHRGALLPALAAGGAQLPAQDPGADLPGSDGG